MATEGGARALLSQQPSLKTVCPRSWLLPPGGWEEQTLLLGPQFFPEPGRAPRASCVPSAVLSLSMEGAAVAGTSPCSQPGVVLTLHLQQGAR